MRLIRKIFNPNKGWKKIDKNNSKESHKNSLSKHFKKEKREPHFILSVFVTTLKMFFMLFVVLGFCAVGIFLGVGKAYLDAAPALDIDLIENQSQTSHIYDKDGNLITEYFGFENRVWVPLEEIPKQLQNAFIATEDIRFFAHNGVDYKRLFGAFISNLKNESTQGGSTITQQLIKNTILTPERTYKRKIQEMYLALQLEKEYDKEQILEAYLNTIHLGESNYGVYAAANDYFGKELKDLSLRECAMLAGINSNPYLYNPRKNFYQWDKPEVIYKRTNLALQLMYSNNFISKEEYEEARIDEAILTPDQLLIKEKSTSRDLYPMPYFIEYVIYDVRDKLMITNGWEGEEGRRKADQLIYAGGLDIYTTVDPAIQYTVEEAIYNYNNYPRFSNSNDNSYRDPVSNKEIKQPQAAAVVIDNSTGELRAIVGGREQPTQKRQLNRAGFHPRSLLPMGSSIKPLAVYGPFIEAGYPGGIVFENIPVDIPGWPVDSEGKKYPENFEGGGYTGPVGVREAITRSLNVVAARIVTERIGIDYSRAKLIDLGFFPDEIKNYSPSALALGSYGSSIIEATAAYAAIANKGIYQQPISFTKVLDKDGKEILNNSSQTKRIVFKESTAYILTDWLENVVQRGTAGKARISGMNVAGKTGTNSNYRGVFFAGFTPYYSATVWIGHDKYGPTFRYNTTAGNYAAPLWKSFMEPIHKDLENKPFYDSPPDDIVKVTVCGVSGKLPNGDLCANDVGGHPLITEWFPKDAVPTKTCDWHRPITVCKYSGMSPTPYCPPEHYEQKSILILPEDSPYHLLTDEQLVKYNMQGAFNSLQLIHQLDYNNPDHRKHFCPIHTAEWKAAETQRPHLTNEANTLINQVKADMQKQQYRNELTPNDLAELDDAIARLEASLNQGLLPASTEEGSVSLPIKTFDPSYVRSCITDLQNKYKSIFDPIKRKVDKRFPFSLFW
jgi:penicillin-binding protein 1A